GGGHVQTAEDIEKGRFAASRCPEEHQQLTAAQLEVNPAQRVHLHLAHVIDLRDATGDEDRLGVRLRHQFTAGRSGWVDEQDTTVTNGRTGWQTGWTRWTRRT